MNLAAEIAAFAALIAASVALAYIHFRHVLLAVSAALAAWCGGLFVPYLPWSGHIAFALLLQPFFVACLLLVYDRIVHAAAAGKTRGTAVKNAVGAVAGSALPVLAALCLALIPVFGASNLASEAASSAPQVLAYAAVLCGAAWLPLLFPYTEGFAVRANRARERREHAAARLATLAQTRWAFSIAGTAAVLAVIAVFGAEHLEADPAARLAWYLPLAAILVFAAAALAARDWRMGLGFTLTLALAAAWMLTYPKTRVLDITLLRDGVALATVAAPLSGIAVEWSRLLRQGDELLAALAQALQREGPPAVLVGLFLSLNWSARAALSFVVPLDLTVILAIFAGLAVFPALTVTIHTLLPRYRSVEDVFGKR